MVTARFKVFMAFIVFFFGALLTHTVTIYVSPRLDIGFLAVKQDVIHLHYWRVAFYVHVFSSVGLLFIGAAQFSQAIRRRFMKVHILFGRAYVVIILGIAGPTGFVLAIHALGGPWSQAGFLALAILWIVFTFLAYRHALRRDIRRHREHMLRSYALTLNAITVRLLGYLAVAFPVVSQIDSYRIGSWLAWIINLACAELLIRSKASAKEQPPQPVSPEGTRAEPAFGARVRFSLLPRYNGPKG